jgi:hypothetical protein
MSLRKLALVALALTFLLTGATLYAQSPHFILSSTQTIVRQFGQTEVVGDLTLTCTALGAGTFPPNSAITVIFNNITGITNSTNGGFAVTSNVPDQTGGINTVEAYVESEFHPPTTAATAITIVTASVNTVVANSITIVVTGTAAPTDIIRVHGIRVNVNPDVPGTPITANVIGTPPNALVIDNVTSIPVALVLAPLSDTNVTRATPVLACATARTGQATGTVSVSELFSSALTTLTDERDRDHTPTGVVGQPLNGTIKVPGSGTQLKLSFANIPLGVIVTVQRDSSTSPTLLLSAAQTFENTTTAAGASKSFSFTVNASDKTANETAVFEVTFQADPTVIPSPPVIPANPITVSVTLAPNITTETNNFTGEVAASSILSFLANPTPPKAIGSLASCVTNLLCKFITTATGAVPGGGYDTGLAISNTSADIFGDFGATPQTGACRVFLFGDGGTSTNINKGTPVFTTPPVVAGHSAVFDMKFTGQAGVGFQGYGIIQCDFQFAHAEAIIADQQFSTFSHGYDCLVIPDVNVTLGREADPGFDAGSGSGESLGQKRIHR